jgi:hypothetical protein
LVDSENEPQTEALLFRCRFETPRSNVVQSAFDQQVSLLLSIDIYRRSVVERSARFMEMWRTVEGADVLEQREIGSSGWTRNSNCQQSTPTITFKAAK